MNLDLNKVNLIKDSWEKTIVNSSRLKFSTDFYNYISNVSCEVRELFVNDIKLPPGVFIFMISSIVNNVERLNEIEPDLVKLGQRHKGYRVRPFMYIIVCRSFIQTIDDWYKNDKQRLEIIQAWVTFFTQLTKIMVLNNDFKHDKMIDINETTYREFKQFIANQMKPKSKRCKCC